MQGLCGLLVNSDVRTECSGGLIGLGTSPDPPVGGYGLSAYSMGDQQIVESSNPIEVVGRRDSLRRHSESKNQCHDLEGRRAAKKPVTPCGSRARDKAANGIDSLRLLFNIDHSAYLPE